jgi:cytochrome c556
MQEGAGLAPALFFGHFWPGGAAAMKCLAVALMFAALAATGARADESCKDQVRESKFTAEMVKSFMTKCKDLATMVCSDRAIDQKVSDEAKDTFIKNCVKDEVGK